MSWQSLRLVPGLDAERTPSLLEGRFTSASLVRWREGLVEKIGGWTPFYSSALDAKIRELRAWQSLNNVKILAVGTETNLDVIANGALQTLTPQIFSSNATLNFSTTSG